MRDQELKDLWEAYQQINQLDEVKTATSIQNDRIPDFETEKKAKQVPGLKVNKPSSPVEEEVEIDIFDYLLEYLVAEGYADTNKSALAIMANMSEEWKQTILEREMDEPGESDDRPDVKAHNRAVKYRPRPRKPRIEDDPRYGTVRDRGGNWKY